MIVLLILPRRLLFVSFFCPLIPPLIEPQPNGEQDACSAYIAKEEHPPRIHRIDDLAGLLPEPTNHHEQK